jgi:antitoxin HigA-1
MRHGLRTPAHPGEVLLEEFLGPMGLTQMDLARHLDVPIQRINEVVRGRRGISGETAWLLSQAFGTTPEFWMNLQVHHDLVACRPKRRVRRLTPAM